MYRKQIRRALGKLMNWYSPRRQRSSLAAAVIETLEQRQLLAIAWVHEPHIQLGDAPLVGSTNYTSTDQINVIWQTTGDVSETYTLDWAPQGTTNWSTAGVSPISSPNTGATDDKKPGNLARINHSATISNLAFNTAYTWRVQQGGTTFTGNFTTRLAPGTTTGFTFVAYGDSADSACDPNNANNCGYNNTGFRDVVNAINSLNPAFALLLGDNAYPSGTQSNLDYRLRADTSNGTINYTMASTSVLSWIKSHIEFPAYGNHDVFSGGDVNGGINGGLASEQNYDTPRPATGTTLVNVPSFPRAEHNYSFDYGSVHFLSFEGNYCNVESDGGACYREGTLLDQELDWAANDLIESDARWKVVFIHEPISSSVGHLNQQPTTEYYRKVLSRLGKDGAGADLLLDGHSHNYQRSYPLVGPYDYAPHFDNTGGSITNYLKGTGLTQIVAGLGGHDLDNSAGVSYAYQAKFSAAKNAYLRIDVTQDVLTIRERGWDNTDLDTTVATNGFTITGSSDTAPFGVIASPLDNGSTDLDLNGKSVLVSSAPSSFVLKLSDSGQEGINNSTVDLDDVAVTRDGVLLTRGTHYSVSYDTARHRMTITPIGSSTFGDGVYTLTLSGITDNKALTPNTITSAPLTIEVDSLIPTTTFVYQLPVDNWVEQTNPGTAHGNADPVFIDSSPVQQALFKYPSIVGTGVGQIPPNSIIRSAQLELTISNEGSGWNAYRMTGSWDGNSTWTSLGGGVIPGTNAASTATDTRGAGNDLANIRGGRQGINVLTDVQGWVDSTFTNQGWGFTPLSGGTNGIQISSAEETVTQNRPKLTIEFISVTFSGGALSIIGTRSADTITLASNGTQVTINGKVLNPTVSPGSVTSILVNGRAGVDTINLSGVNSTNGFSLPAAAVTIMGGSGNDSITGSPFNDNMAGGIGNDTYLFPATTGVNLGSDTITEVADIDTDTLNFASFNPSAGSTNNIDISSTSLQTVLSGFLSLTFSSSTGIENVTGSINPDNITGNARNNTLSGSLGNDTFMGMGGDDSLVGSTGSDTYKFSGSANLNKDTINEGGTSDTDVLDFSGFSQTAIVDLSNNTSDQTVASGVLTLRLVSNTGIENIIGSNSPDNFTGNTQPNVLSGGGGNDVLTGGAGNDTLIGGSGDDALVGGADNDTADYSTNNDSQPVDITLNGSADDADGLGGTDNVDTETVLGGAGNDSLTGGAGGDFLKGNGGSDTIHGDGGDDTLFGDADYDRVYGDDGNDEIHGGAGGDALFGDRIAYAGPGNPGNDVIWGDADNDDINGGHWAIAANDGSDVIHGGTGSDRYYFIGGNIGNDVVDDATDMAPVDIDWIIFNWGWSSDITLHLDSAYVGVQQNLSGGGSITLSNANSIENVWTGTGNDWIYGDDRGNYLDGQAGDDHIYGGPGNDQLAGYDGYDYLYGEGDDDWMWPEYGGGEMWGGLGNDTYDFVMTSGPNYFVYEAAIVGGTDGSSDTLDFTGSFGPVNIDLASTGYQYMFITLKLSDGMGIENVYTSQNDFYNWSDTIYGNARPNILKGGVGNDSLYGRAGADTLYGEGGDDLLDAGGTDGAVDQLIGGPGTDVFQDYRDEDILTQ